MTQPTSEPRKYRKKPVVIEAVRLPEDGVGDSHKHVSAMADWCDGVVVNPGGLLTDPYSIAIFTLEGEMLAGPGDFIIKGVKGEFYPCKNDIFEATYDQA